MGNIVARYVVNGDADDLVGWTPETLAEALRSPLSKLGVEVVCHPNESGLGGLLILDALPYGEMDRLRIEVDTIVERVIQG